MTMSSNDRGPLFELPPQYVELQAEARALADSLTAQAGIADEASSFDPVVRAALAKSGLTAVMVSAEYGGRFERVDSLAVTVVREALAGTSAHLDSMFAMQGIGSYPLSVAGTKAVRARWLRAVGSLDAVAALALTEPQVGSDLKAITTVVKRSGEDLIVDGRKSFITNAGDADFYSVLCREDDGYSLVLVPAQTPGVSVTKPHQIIAPHVLGDVALDQVRVPADHRIGEPGEGFKLMLSTLATFRVSVAGAAIGLAQAALDEAVRYTAGRTQFGVPLAKLGQIPSQLALSWTEIEMARSLAYRAAAAASVDAYASLHLSSMAKVGATEVAGRVTDRAVQVTGRFGLTRGGVIERMYREARPMRIYEGATEVILGSLAKQLVKRTGEGIQ
jgi:acyl-CoA dehydrogenase